MDANHARGLSKSSRSHWLRRIPWLLIPILLLAVGTARAQQLTGTISGIVNDQADARIPGAKIVIKNDASGDTRTSVADNQGFFSVTALPPGSYSVTISSKGFASWEETGIVLSQGDSRTIANIRLKISSDTTAVTVISGADAEVPTDTAEVSSTLNNELVDSAVLTGRNAAELIKMMPGVAFNNAGGVGSGASLATSTNSGPAGSFSANGTQPYGSTDVYLDGANLIDPGNAGTQVANINQDMTDSIKYLSASYGAEYAKGPAVLQAFSKSGGQKFHGEAYVYARNSNIGFANDAYVKSTELGQGNPNSVEAQSYYYFGGNVGGPIFFPHFNHNRDKLFFWGGYEYMKQNPFSSPAQMNVPTQAELSGDFSTTSVPQGVLNTYPNAYALPCSTDDGWQGCSQQASPWGKAYNGSNWTNGQPPNIAQYFDPMGVSFTALENQQGHYQTPTAKNGWNNFISDYGDPSAGYATITGNRWEATGKLTYAFNDNNKLWGSYAYQTEQDAHPVAVWWNPAWTIPYPTDPSGTETAHLYLANYTHVFSATSTNEVVFAYAEFVNDITQTNPAKSNRSAINFPTQSLFAAGSAGNSQIPNGTGGWEAGVPEINYQSFNGGIYGKNSFGKTSKAPSIADTFTKIIGTHSIKAGFYWDAQENIQSAGKATNGNYDVENWGATSTYNMTLDRLMGRNYNYTEQNTDPVPDELWHQWSIWGQDSWKITRKLTLNLGLRADHMGQWYDKLGGTQVWDAATYVNTPNPPANTGLVWHATNSSVPNSGWASKLFEYSPRVGVAYDLFGNGKSVLRAGFGTYWYQVSNNDAGNAMFGPLGSYSFATSQNGLNGFYGYGIAGGLVYTQNPITTTNPAQTQLVVPTANNQVGTTGLIADVMGDNKVPYADTYSFGVAQALPAHTVMEISYVGSASRNQLENGSNGHVFDANPMPFGSFFTTDPQTGKYENVNPIGPGGVPCPSGASCTGVSQTDWQALRNYGHIYLQGHGGYANYNSLQMSAQKQSGNLYLFSNFTFGKVLGTRDGSTSNGNGNGSVVDPFNFSNNYGTLGYDHTKIFNLSASYKLPKPIHGNAILGQIVNGWQLSTYTTYQDGSPYQANNVNMNMNNQQYHCGTNDSHAGCSGQAAGFVVNVPITLPYPAGATVYDSQGQDVGPTTYSTGTVTWFGTGQYESGSPQPLIICNPRAHLAKGQYFNPSCFAAPLPPTATSIGQQGPLIWPYIRTPHYFGSDLALFKAFRVNDSQRFEVRVSATNWLNHPNGGFGIGGNNSDNTLLFNGLSSGSQLVTNSQANTTGFPGAKQGFRWIQFAGKYYF
jgi:hypothetical protein